MRVLLLLLMVFASGCKHKSPADLQSPEAALQSFFKALNDSRIPDELSVFVLDIKEKGAWKMRCKMHGCKKGTYEILEVEKRGESSAVLILNYSVVGKKGRVLMQGKRSPVSFERIGSNWGITRFGRRLGAPVRPTTNDAGSGKDARP